MLANMLDLSMAHVPEKARDGAADFAEHCGKLGSCEHTYGYIVFVAGSSDADGIPDWLRPIHMAAEEDDCILINFDQDAGIDPRFKTYG